MDSKLRSWLEITSSNWNVAANSESSVMAEVAYLSRASVSSWGDV